MKHLTFVLILLCIFACNSKKDVSTVEESVEPANEVAVNSPNLLDSLEIMDYIDSIINPMHKKRSNQHGDSTGRHYAHSNTRSQSEINAGKIKEMYESCQENIVFSQDELALISKKARASKENARFESLFNEWKEAWEGSFSSNTITTRQLPQYAELKAMGKDIIPLLIEKMATEEDNFFAIRLYEDLINNPNLIIRYANGDPHQFEGLVQTTKKTIKKWLEYNSN